MPRLPAGTCPMPACRARPHPSPVIIEAVGIGVTLQSLLDPESVPVELAAKGIELILSTGRIIDGAP